MADKYILAIDEGTTSTRAIIYDHQGRQIAKMNQTQISQSSFYGITETIRQMWGGFDRYFTSLGFDRRDLERLRNKFLE